MKHINVKDGDVLVLRTSSHQNSQVIRELLTDLRERLPHKRIALIALPDDCDLEVLDEAQMNRLGWFRHEQNDPM